MVLGGPGVGKSTFLRKVGLEALKGKDGNFAHECTPIFLELKRVTKVPIDVKTLIVHELEICGSADPEQKAMKALESGEFLILFDGLDEVPTVIVNDVTHEIADFVDQYRQNRFIASSRISAYKGGFTQFAEVEMTDFDDSQVKAYINNWFASTSNGGQQSDGEMEAANLCWLALNASEHKATKALARNPLLLAFLCMVYKGEQNFPQNRTDLYREALNIFLKKWPAEKHIRRDSSISQSLNVLTIKEVLFEIAAENFKADRVLFRGDELVNQIREFCQKSTDTAPSFDASKTLDTILIDSGLFVERVNGLYSFFHLTYQEYLAASHFVSTQSIQRLVTEHLYDERWREVFLFAAELMPEADSLLLEIETEATKSINTDGLKTLFRWAKRITNTSDNLYGGVAKRAFAIRQYFTLHLLNRVYEIVRNLLNPRDDVNLYSDFCDDLDFYRNLMYSYRYYDDLYVDFNQLPNPDLYFKGRIDEELLDVEDVLDENFCHYLSQNFYRDDLHLFLKLYDDLSIDLYPDPDFNFYQDLYQYTDTGFYSFISPEFGDRFDGELRKRITLVQLIEEAKIFRKVDLQQLIQRFNEQRQFIIAAREGSAAEPPKDSIHDTWVSVLGITDNMLAMPREEKVNYVRYFRAMVLIFECKKAAGRVSPEVWQKIENRLLAWDVEEVED